MQTDPIIDPDHAREAAEALLAVMTDILEFALDQCTAVDAVERLPLIGDLCRDAAALADASAMIMRRTAL